MRIAIVGAGNVGKALGIGWRGAGHQVSYALRDPVGKSAVELRKAGLTAMAMAEAAAKAEAIVIAVPWPEVSDALRGGGCRPAEGSAPARAHGDILDQAGGRAEIRDQFRLRVDEAAVAKSGLASARSI
jgi:3-hydroxyisobutyrate dehydrogenase-like beta-hydroxyacid dehydrogenase